MKQLDFFAAEPPASPSASPDSEKAWMTAAVTSCLPLVKWLQNFVPHGSNGKTSPVFFQVEEDETFQRFWDSSADGKFQSLKEVGERAESSPDIKTPTDSLTGCLMRNISEWPSDGAACSLSDILETGDLPLRYFLSAKACAGILRRAEKRGKKLPQLLMSALEEVAKRVSPLPED